MIDWLKLISSGLMDSLIQVSVLIFSFFFRRPWLGSFAKVAECLSAIACPIPSPRTGNQVAWHSLEVSRTLSPDFQKFLCFCKRLHHEFAGGTSGCFRQQMEEPYEFVKGGSGFRRALKELPIRDIFFFHVHCKIWSAGAMNQLTQRDQFKSSRLLWTSLQLSVFLGWALCQSWQPLLFSRGLKTIPTRPKCAIFKLSNH